MLACCQGCVGCAQRTYSLCSNRGCRCDSGRRCDERVRLLQSGGSCIAHKWGDCWSRSRSRLLSSSREGTRGALCTLNCGAPAAVNGQMGSAGRVRKSQTESVSKLRGQRRQSASDLPLRDCAPAGMNHRSRAARMQVQQSNTLDSPAAGRARRDTSRGKRTQTARQSKCVHDVVFNADRPMKAASTQRQAFFESKCNIFILNADFSDKMLGVEWMRPPSSAKHCLADGGSTRARSDTRLLREVRRGHGSVLSVMACMMLSRFTTVLSQYSTAALCAARPGLSQCCRRRML